MELPNPRPTTAPTFDCIYCDKKYANNWGLERHYRRVYEGTTAESEGRHDFAQIRLDHPELELRRDEEKKAPYDCGYCGKKCHRKERLLQHFRDVYAGKTAESPAQHDFAQIRLQTPTWELAPESPEPKKALPTKQPKVKDPSLLCIYCKNGVLDEAALEAHFTGVYLRQIEEGWDGQHDFDEIRHSCPSLAVLRDPRPDAIPMIKCPYCFTDVVEGGGHMRAHIRRIWSWQSNDYLAIHDFDVIRREHPEWFETGMIRPPPPLEQCSYCLTQAASLTQHFVRMFMSRTPMAAAHDFQQIRDAYPSISLFQGTPASADHPPKKPIKKTAKQKSADKRKRQPEYFCKHNGCEHKDQDSKAHLAHMLRCGMPGPHPHPCAWQGCPLSFPDLEELNQHHKECPFMEQYRYPANVIRQMQSRAHDQPWDSHVPTPQQASTRFRCRQLDCTQDFELMQHMMEHWRKYHASDAQATAKFRCAWEGCGAPFKTPNLLARHVDRHNKPVARSDILISETTSAERSNAALQHFEDPKIAFHRYRCQFGQCESTYYSMEELYLHQDSHLPGQPSAGLKCPCGEFSDDIEHHSKHLREHVKSITTYLKSTKHTGKVSTGIEKFSCGNCWAKFGSRAGYIAHQCANAELRCGRKGCGKHFTNQTACEYHRKLCQRPLLEVDSSLHNKKKTWQCRRVGCDKTFGSIGRRNEHESACSKPPAARLSPNVLNIIGDMPELNDEQRGLMIALIGRITATSIELRGLAFELERDFENYTALRNQLQGNIDHALLQGSDGTPRTVRQLREDIKAGLMLLPYNFSEASEEIDGALPELDLREDLSEAIEQLNDSPHDKRMEFAITVEAVQRGDMRVPTESGAVNLELRLADIYLITLNQLGQVFETILDGARSSESDESDAEEDDVPDEDEDVHDPMDIDDNEDDSSQDDDSDTDTDSDGDDGSEERVTKLDDEFDETDPEFQQALLESLGTMGHDTSVLTSGVPARNDDWISSMFTAENLNDQAQLLQLFSKQEPLTSKQIEAGLRAARSAAGRARESDFIARIMNEGGGIVLVRGRRYRLQNVLGDGNCMHRAFAVGHFGHESYLPRVRADLRRHILDAFGASEGLDLSDLLMDLYIELDQQIHGAGGTSLVQQMVRDGAWGSIELAQVFAILYGVEVVVHQPTLPSNLDSVDWGLIARGHTGQPQVHLVNWINSNHWMALIPLDDGTMDTSQLMPYQRTPIAIDVNGLRIPPRVDPARFLRRTLPESTTITRLDRQQDRGEATIIDSEDHDLSPGIMLTSTNVPPALRRPNLPRRGSDSSLLARAIEVNNPFRANEFLTGNEVARRRKFDFMQFGKYRAVDVREYESSSSAMEEDELELIRHMEQTSLATDVDVAGYADEDATLLLEWPSNILNENAAPPTGAVLVVHRTTQNFDGTNSVQQERIPVSLNSMQLTRTDHEFLQRYGQPRPTWLCIGRFSDLRPIAEVLVHLASHNIVLQDCIAAIHAREAVNPALMPRIGPATGRVRRFWINDRSAAEPIPVYDSPRVIPEHLAIMTEVTHNDLMLPRPRVYLLIRSISGLSVAPTFFAIRQRWPALHIFIYIAFRDSFVAAAANQVMGPHNVIFTPRTAIGMHYNEQAVDLDHLVAAERHHGNGQAHGGSALADSIWHWMTLEYAARVGWMPWQPDAVNVFMRNTDRNGWQ
ncbi:hypothetical protein LTS10_004063 [Elasticomyces elasticus]|nr:hypothetical protein LTS10_004063 [Elasticomyces elasticus]